MRSQANKHRTDVEFQVGDLVYVRLKLQPYRQNSVALRSCHKLAAVYFGPFPITARVGKVDYRLQLPPTSKVHLVFQISQLKKHAGSATVQSYMPEIDEEGLIKAEPIVRKLCSGVCFNTMVKCTKRRGHLGALL